MTLKIPKKRHPLPMNPIEKCYSKSVMRKAIFALKFRKPGWTEQSKVESNCILLQPDTLCEHTMQQSATAAGGPPARTSLGN